jgi:hypothetical protein
MVGTALRKKAKIKSPKPLHFTVQACRVSGSNDGSFDDEHDGGMIKGDETTNGDGQEGLEMASDRRRVQMHQERNSQRQEPSGVSH